MGKPRSPLDNPGLRAGLHETQDRSGSRHHRACRGPFQDAGGCAHRGCPLAQLALQAHDLRGVAQAIKVPVLITWGTRDLTAPTRWGRAVADAIPEHASPRSRRATWSSPRNPSLAGRGRAVRRISACRAPTGLQPAADANPSQVCRLPAQHHPTFGASRRSAPSRPVPLLTQIARSWHPVRPSGPCLRDPIVMKQRPRSRVSGRCSSQYSPSVRVSGVRPAAAMAGSASAGLQLDMASPRSRPSDHIDR